MTTDDPVKDMVSIFQKDIIQHTNKTESYLARQQKELNQQTLNGFENTRD